MEAWQHVKLSLTNRSIGLFLLRTRPAQQQARKKTPIPRPHKHPSDASHRIPRKHPQDTYGVSRRPVRAVGRPGGHSEGPAPDPISNSAVKHTSAHGTVSQDTGESVAARPAKHRQHAHTEPHSLSTISDHPGAGWSSPVARQAHNLKVVGSNPTPATNSERPVIQR